MTRNQRQDRREFLKSTALIGMSGWVVGRGTWADDTTPNPSNSPNERLRFACIGVAGKGDGDSDHVAKFGDVVALCDIDESRLEKKSRQPGFEKATKFNDYRKMFDEVGKGIDAVTVSTPDHHHAIASMIAIKLGKHVYTQKPLTRTVHEARSLRDAARQYKVCTQMGNQGTATDAFRRSVEVLRAALGPVSEVHVWTNRPQWPQAPTVMSRPASSPLPPGIHWDEWIGPAPMRPWAEYDLGNGKREGAYHNQNWRGFQDFGTGALGDMGCHTANLAFMGLDLAHPTSIQAQCGDANTETYPSWATVVYEFPARGNQPAVKLTWYEGHRANSKDPKKRNLPGPRATANMELLDSGALIVGRDAMMLSQSDYGAKQKIIFDDQTEGVAIHAPRLFARLSDPARPVDMDELQKVEWIAAIRAGDYKKATANFDYASLLTETILLGDVAIQAGKKLEFDGEAMTFTNAPDANHFLTRDYRAGWTL